MIKSIDNAFDHMIFSFVSYEESVKINLIFPEIAFMTEFPSSNFLLPSFLTGGMANGFSVA